jgi:hypothetical protein
VTTPDRPRPPRKPVALFALHALLLALLIGWWPTPRALYPSFVHAHAGALLGAGRDDVVVLRANPSPKESEDTLMEEFAPGASAPRWQAQLSTLNLGWWPFAVLAALLLATPMTARRRALALCGGFAWVEAYLLLRLAAEVAYANFEASAGPGAASSGTLHSLLRTSASVLEANAVLFAMVLIGYVVLGRPGASLDTSALRRMLPAARRA